MSDRIYIDIDLTALDAALNRLEQAMGAGGVASARGVTGMGDAVLSDELIRKQSSYIEGMIDDQYSRRILPAVNRDVRLIIGRIPGMSELLSAGFAGRRLERGVAIGGPTMYLALAATVLMLWNMSQQHSKQIEQLNKSYEQAVRSITGIGEKEYQRWLDEYGGKPFRMGEPW